MLGRELSADGRDSELPRMASISQAYEAGSTSAQCKLLGLQWRPDPSIGSRPVEKVESKSEVMLRQAPKNQPAQKAIRRIVRKRGISIAPVPCNDATGRHPGPIRKRVLRIGKKLCGIHYIRNVQRRENRNVQYARVQVYRSSVLAQDEKLFYIAPPNRRPRIVTKSRRELLRLFPRGKRTVTIYFAL
jgi:hypothetical protein